MPSNLSRRVARLEDETVGYGRTLHVIDVSNLPRNYDVDRAMKELGLEVKCEDLVVILVDPTNREPPPGGKPKHLYSKPVATGRR